MHAYPSVGRIAIQQALVKHFGLSYRQTARLMHIHHRTVWQHVAARRGANCAAWEARPVAGRLAAITAAAWMMG